MSVLRLDADGLARFNRMRAYVPGQANLNPPKRISRLRELLQTQSPRVAIVRGEGIGDVLMTTPLIYSLKRLFPGGASITYATNTRYLDGALTKVLEHNPDIDTVIDRETLDESNYDLVINLHCPCVAYERKENPPINRIHLFAKHAGVPLLDTRVRYFPLDSEIEYGRDFLQSSGIRSSCKTILVQVFSTATKRNLNNVEFKRALTNLACKDIKLVILQHDSDYPSDVLFDNIPYSVVLKNADIRRIASIMYNCDLVLCPDSSILHLAGALDKPTVSLFGHTDPRARVDCYPNVMALWPGEYMSCVPCWAGDCHMNLACYKAITADMIVAACLEKLGLAKLEVPRTIYGDIL
jgi:ADP-heptose:LPS heptosyltransferase